MKKKVLNLYAGIGGNRKLWTDCEVTAVEYNSEIAAIYKDFFPQDDVIVGDAHDFLLKHYKDFDFIWTSPPCQTHSSLRKNLVVRFRGAKPQYPDMKLWQEIIFLKHHAECKWVVENVNPYYEDLIPGKLIQRHKFWANFTIQNIEVEPDVLRSAQIPHLQKHHGVDLSRYKIKNKRQILRNAVYPPIGLHIFNQAMGILSAENTEQLKLAI